MQNDRPSVQKRRIMIEIPEKELQEMFGWLRKGTDEWAIRAYLLKHLEVFDEDLNMTSFIGFNIYFMEKDEIDMLFRKNGIYYLVETKQKGKYHKGWKQLVNTVESFSVEMIERGEQLEEIVAVLATSYTRTGTTSIVKKLPWFTPEELADLV